MPAGIVRWGSPPGRRFDQPLRGTRARLDEMSGITAIGNSC